MNLQVERTTLKGSPEKRKDHWLNHFKSLLGNQPVLNTEALPLTQIFDELDITTSSFTKHELTKCVKLFSNNKSSGFDNIPKLLWICFLISVTTRSKI